MNSYTADSARRTVADGMGQQPALMMSLQHVVGITDSDVAYLAGLDEQIVALQAARNDAAAAIYENRPSITNDHVADVADAEVATMREFHGRAAFFGISEDEALVDEAVENMLEAAMGNDPGKFFV